LLAAAGVVLAFAAVAEAALIVAGVALLGGRWLWGAPGRALDAAVARELER
jgi:hypothetical protein